MPVEPEPEMTMEPASEMTVKPESEMPGLWSEHNLPSLSAMLKLIRAVCAYPVITSDQTLTTSISDTPPNVPNPTIDELTNLLVGLNFYNDFPHDDAYLPLQALGGTEYTLSILPISPQSLNTALSVPRCYHCLLQLTRLHFASSTTTLRTIALGRILYRERPTYWIIVMEIIMAISSLYALIPSHQKSY
jgi:hypothetical protein